MPGNDRTGGSVDGNPDSDGGVVDQNGDGTDEGTVAVTVRDGDEETVVAVERGAILRDALREAGFSPYTAVTERLNCGGRGLCATCGVRIVAGPPPAHWHDRLADRYGYPRLSCQVTVDRDMTVELLPDKRIWGGRA